MKVPCAGWFALQVRPNCEASVRQMLISKGYICFFPIERSRRRWADRFVEKEIPLFRSYVFCHLDPEASMRTNRVVSTPGVRRIVSFGGTPVPVHAHEIEALQKLMQTNYPRTVCSYIRSGTRVRVTEGPLADVEGICLSHDRHKLLLSVPLLQRSVLVTLDHSIAVDVLATP